MNTVSVQVRFTAVLLRPCAKLHMEISSSAKKSLPYVFWTTFRGVGALSRTIVSGPVVCMRALVFLMHHAKILATYSAILLYLMRRSFN